MTLINKFTSDYKVISVGDATMGPYEIAYPGGSVEHWNEEPGSAWLNRITNHFDKSLGSTHNRLSTGVTINPLIL